jgi:DNA-binding PadR family transcriptional regulator
MSEDAKSRVEQMLREAAPILKQQDRTAAVPAHVLAKLIAAQEKKFPAWKELTSKEMAPLILKVLAQGKMDGFDLISRLEKARIRNKDGGEAVNYGVLNKLAAEGFVQVDLDDSGGQIRKVYRLTETGHNQVRQVKAEQLSTLTEAILAAG